MGLSIYVERRQALWPALWTRMYPTGSPELTYAGPDYTLLGIRTFLKHLPAEVWPGRVAVGRKRISGFLFLTLLLGAGVPSLAQDQPNFYAVIIGVSQFANLPKDDWLEYADADARDMAKFLQTPRGRAFPADNVKVFTNEQASVISIKRWLGTALPKKLKPEDTVYIFIATHGMVEKEAAKAAYLLANDSDREDLYTTALAMKDLSDIVQNRLKGAKRIILLADACRAGKLGQGQGNIGRAIEDASRRGELMGLLASRPNEFSQEGKQWGGGHGVFSYFLLKGLMGEADSDKDKTVTAQELVAYVQSNVPAATDKKQNVRDFGEFEPTTPLSFTDKESGDLKLATLRHPGTAELASAGLFLQAPAAGQPERAALQQAIREGRLVSPAGNNAWELYQRFSALPVPQDAKDAVQEELIAALGTAGDRVLSAYRRGDQVVRLDAARYQEGALLFQRASELDPNERSYMAKARFMAGRAAVEAGRYTEAITVLREAISLDPNAAYSYNALGIAFMQQRQWDEAITNYRAALERAENWVYPRFNLAVVYTHLQRFREAEAEYNKAIEVGTTLGARYSYLHLNLGALYLQQNRYQDAERELKRALQMRADDPQAHYNMGLVYLRSNTAQAERWFERAASLDARMSLARLRLAEIYAGRGRRDLQEKYLREAAAGDPGNPVVLEELGKLLLSQKKLDDAEQVFMQMMTADTASPVPLSWLGDVHREQKRFADAAEDYRGALSRATDEKFRRDLQKKLSDVEKKK